MRKKIIQKESHTTPSKQQNWLNLEQLAQVEVTSEEEEHPIERAFTGTADNEEGWIAAQPGEQMIRLVFDAPQNIGQIKLLFRVNGQERTQGFLLRWQSNND